MQYYRVVHANQPGGQLVEKSGKTRGQERVGALEVGMQGGDLDTFTGEAALWQFAGNNAKINQMLTLMLGHLPLS